MSQSAWAGLKADLDEYLKGASRRAGPFGPAGGPPEGGPTSVKRYHLTCRESRGIRATRIPAVPARGEVVPGSRYTGELNCVER